MNNSELQSFLGSWNKEKCLEKKSFDDLFQIEGVPLWWFYRKFFYTHVMPRQLNTLKTIEAGKKLNLAEKFKFYLSAKGLKKYIQTIENRKISYSCKIKKKAASANKKVLLLSYSNHLSKEGKIFRLERLVEIIKKDQKFEPWVLFIDPLSRRSYKKISGLNNIYRYYDEKTAREAGKKSKELFKKWQTVKESDKINLFKNEKKSLWPYLKYPFDFFLSKEFLYFTCLYYELFKKIIFKENIQAVVITGAVSLFERCLVAAAKQMKIPVVRIEHGIAHDTGRHAELIGYTNEAVISNFIKNKIVELGVKKENVTVVGPVVYDEIAPYIGPKSKPEKNVLITPVPLVESLKLERKDYFNKITKIINQIQKIEGVKIAIKLHPREIYYQDYLNLVRVNKYKNVDIFRPNIAREEFYGLIKKSDVFVHFGSCAALEAMIIGRPVVTVSFLPKSEYSYWLNDSKATINVEHNGDIKGAISKALKDEVNFRIQREKIVRKYCSNVDGKASERVAELIYKMIKNNPFNN